MRKMNYVPVAMFLWVACLTAEVSAQYRFGPMPYSYGYGRGYGRASTVQEGAARGLADVIRSRGRANLLNSEAAKNYEEARKKRIDNRLHWTQTYFDMRRINKQARAELRGRRRSQEQTLRVNLARVPDRLSPAQLDPLTGSLTWPLMLRLQDFDGERQRIEELYAARAKNGYVAPEQYMELRQLTARMREQMIPLRKGFTGNHSIEARKFLDSLDYEAQFPVG